jgi:hypothetical protein
MSPDQQTNQPTSTNYISVRITVPHSDVEQVVKLCSDYNYCIYMHKAGTDNEHFHVCFPDGKPEAIRQRLKRTWPDRGGNKFCSVKSYANGLRSFVFYCHHEGANPVFKDQVWQGYVDEVIKDGAYKKHDKTQSTGVDRKVRERLSNPQLTMSNLLRQSLKWARENDTGARDLGSVLKRMVNHGWDPDYGLLSKGVPSEYYDIFAARMQGKSIEEQDWMKPHKRKERLGDVPEIDTDYQFTKRSLMIPRPHE